MRAYALSAERVPMALSVASVVMDRALGVMSILLLGVVSLWVGARPGAGRAWHRSCGSARSGAPRSAAVVFSARARAAARSRLSKRLPWPGLRRLAARLLEAVREYGTITARWPRCSRPRWACRCCA